MNRAVRVALMATTFVLSAAAAQAEEKTIKIGVMGDMSSLYADITGPGSVAAAKLAIEDFNPAAHGMKVDLIFADHQNKADIGSNIARQWYDTEHVDAIADVPTSSVALAVNEVAREKNKTLLLSGPASSDITGPKCSPNSVHWTFDTWMLAHGTGGALVKNGGDTWFFLTSDYAFGHALYRDTAAVVEASGGKVLGQVLHPINTSDFSSFLLQAQASKAKIVGLANAGGDTINSIKQAAEFGIVAGGQKLAGLLVFVTDVDALGLKTAQGLVLTSVWYHDMNDANREWTKRWQVERPGKLPSMVQAGVYSSVLHYLKAIDALPAGADGRTVIAKMKELPTDDVLFGKGTVRIDGRHLHPAYLLEVKKPEESKYRGDYFKVLATIPAEDAARPLKDGHCPLVQN